MGEYRTSTCRDCHRPVIWVVLSSGKRMAVDVDADAAGTVAIRRDASGTPVGRVLRKGESPDPYERAHVTHFASCTRPRAARPARLPDGVVSIERARQARLNTSHGRRR